jgi:hypothetical protein
MERTTLATTGLGLEPPASAPDAEVAAVAASCQEWETMGGHFMSHTERPDRAVSRCLATPAIAAGSAVFQRVVWFIPEVGAPGPVGGPRTGVRSSARGAVDGIL